MCFKVIFFDLDDTLYPPAVGLWEAIRVRIDRYMVERMKLPSEIVPALRKELFLKHGTTMRGLQAQYHIDEKDYLDFVHDVPVADYLTPNPELRRMLEKYPQRKVIFTNADTNHANRVILSLGLQGCFDQIIDIQDIDPYCKPQVQAFSKAIAIAGIDNPSQCVMIDDAPRNLQAASEIGLYTIQIGSGSCSEGINAAIQDLVDLPKVIPLKESYKEFITPNE